MTTDLVVDLEVGKQIATVAVNVKPRLKWNYRTIQKMELERAIYENRKQGWLIGSDLVKDPVLEWNLLFLRQHFDLAIESSPKRFLKEFKLQLTKTNPKNLESIIGRIAKILRIEVGDSYQLFYHLLARKKIKFDYYKRLDKIDSLTEFHLA
jgi:hypothetical protein